MMRRMPSQSSSTFSPPSPPSLQSNRLQSNQLQSNRLQCNRLQSNRLQSNRLQSIAIQGGASEATPSSLPFFQRGLSYRPFPSPSVRQGGEGEEGGREGRGARTSEPSARTVRTWGLSGAGIGILLRVCGRARRARPRRRKRIHVRAPGSPDVEQPAREASEE